MNVRVDGEERVLDDGTTIDALLDVLVDDRDGVAVAVNNKLVPRRRHGVHLLHEGDRIEVIHAVSGG